MDIDLNSFILGLAVFPAVVVLHLLRVLLAVIPLPSDRKTIKFFPTRLEFERLAPLSHIKTFSSPLSFKRTDMGTIVVIGTQRTVLYVRIGGGKWVNEDDESARKLVYGAGKVNPGNPPFTEKTSSV